MPPSPSAPQPTPAPMPAPTPAESVACAAVLPLLLRSPAAEPWSFPHPSASHDTPSGIPDALPLGLAASRHGGSRPCSSAYSETTGCFYGQTWKGEVQNLDNIGMCTCGRYILGLSSHKAFCEISGMLML